MTTTRPSVVCLCGRPRAPNHRVGRAERQVSRQIKSDRRGFSQGDPAWRGDPWAQDTGQDAGTRGHPGHVASPDGVLHSVPQSVCFFLQRRHYGPGLGPASQASDVPAQAIIVKAQVDTPPRRAKASPRSAAGAMAISSGPLQLAGLH